MSFDTDLISKTLDALLDEVPDRITIASRDYPCAQVTASRALIELQASGAIEAVDVVVSVRKTALASVPARGSTVTYDGATRRILHLDTSPDKLDLRIALGTQYA